MTVKLPFKVLAIISMLSKQMFAEFLPSCVTLMWNNMVISQLAHVKLKIINASFINLFCLLIGKSNYLSVEHFFYLVIFIKQMEMVYVGLII